MMQEQDAREYAEAFKESGQPPWLHALYMHWQELFKEPYRGITNDGTVCPKRSQSFFHLHISLGEVRDGLFKLRDDGIPIDEITAAANELLDRLEDEDKRKLSYHIDSPEWRTWTNPEFLLNDKGLRLDEMWESDRDRVLKILEATLSGLGYERAIGAMRINHFLGELVEAPKVMNEYSYNFVLFGEPSTERPWGFSLYGHHLCLNIFLYKTQIVMSPLFTGAEPNLIDAGPYKGEFFISS